MGNELKILVTGEVILDAAKINAQLKKITGIDTLKIGIDVQSMDKLTSQIDQLQKQVSQLNAGQGINLFDGQQVKQTEMLKKDFNEIVAAKKVLTDTKDVKIFKTIDKETKDITDFTLQVTKANDVVEKFNYTMGTKQLSDGSYQSGYIEAPRYKESDATDKSLQIEKQKTIELEHQLNIYKQQMQMKIQMASRRYDGLIDTSALNSYSDKINDLKVDTPNLKHEMDNLNIGFKQVEVDAKNSAKALDIANKSSISLGDAIKTAAIKFPLWVGISTLFYGTIRGFKDVLNNIKEVDTQITQLKRVMDEDTNFNYMLDESIKLANELGRSINDLLESAIEFGRQGFNEEQVLYLSEVTSLLQNVSDITVDEAVDALTSSMNNFNITAENSISIADKLNEVDNNYAVSTQQLAVSMYKAAASAKVYGVSIDEVIGQTTAVAEVTRESGEIIGNFLKTYYSRINSTASIKELSSIGISIKDINGEMKSSTEVTTELANKWGTLTAEQQQNLGVTLAGRRQLSRFFALMDNYQSSLDATETSLNSQGSAMRENAKYMESIVAKLNLLKSAWTELSLTIGDSGLTSMFVGSIEGLTTLLKGINEITEATNAWNFKILILAPSLYGLIRAGLGLKTVLTGVTWSLTGIGVASEKAAISLGILRVTANGLKLSFGWIGAVAVGVGLLASYFIGLKKSTDESIDSNIQNLKTINDEINLTNELIDKTETLQKNENKSIEQTNELVGLERQLAEILPKATTGYDEQNIALAENLDILRQLNKEKKDSLLNEAYETLNELAPSIESDRQKLKWAEENSRIDQQELDRLAAAGKFGTREFTNQLIKLSNVNEVVVRLRDNVSKYEAAQAAVLAVIKNSNTALQTTVNTNGELSLTYQLIDEETGELIQSTQTLSDVIGEYDSRLGNLSDAYQTLNSGERLSLDTIQSLIEEFPELNKHLELKNGLLTISKEAIEDVAKTEKESYVDTFEIMKEELEYRRDALLSKLDMDLTELKSINDLNEAYRKRLILAKSIAEAMAIEKGYNDASGVQQQIDSMNALIDSVNGFDLSTSGDSKSTIDLDARYKDFINTIRDTNHEIDMNNALMEVASDSDKILILQEQNVLYERLKNELHALNVEREREMSTLSVSSDRYQKLLGEVQKTSIEIVKLDNKQKDLISTTKELNETVKNLTQSLIDSYADGLKRTLKDEMERLEEAKKNEIKIIQEQIDALKKVNDELNEQFEREKRLLEIEKARLNLTNVQKERNTQIYMDGGFKWVANPRAVREAQENLDKLVADYNEWERETSHNNRIKALEAQIEAITNKYDNDIKIIEQLLKNLDKVTDKSVDSQINSWDELIRKLEELGVAYKEELSGIIGWIGEYNNAVLGMKNPSSLSAISTSTGATGFTPTGQSKTDDILAQMAANSKAWHTASSTDKAIYAAKNQELGASIGATYKDGYWDVLKYHDGGQAVDEQVAILKKKEIVLNEDDSKNFLSAIDMTRQLVKSPTVNIAQIQKQSPTSTVQNHYHFDNMTVRTNDASQFMNGLKRTVYST